MSNSRKANLITAVAKRQRFANLWPKLESRNIHHDLSRVKIQCFSSNATSSIHYDNRVSPTKPLNGIHRNDSNRKRSIPPPKSNGEAIVQSTINNARKEETKVNGTKVELAQTSPSELTFAGDTSIPVTSRLHIVTPEEDAPRGIWPIFRIMVSQWIAFCRDVNFLFLTLSNETRLASVLFLG